LNIHRIANILVVSRDLQRLSIFSSELGNLNFHVKECSPENYEEEAKTSHPDLIIIDLSCDDFDGFDATQNLKSNPVTSNIPVILMSEDNSDDMYLRGIEAKADDIFTYSNNFRELAVHLKPLLRLSTMFAELDNRMALARKFKAPIDDQITPDENAYYKILLIAPKDGDKATLETILDGKCEIDVCGDFFSAEDKLTIGFYDVAISNLDGGNEEIVLGLCSRARNNPRLFNLPMVLLSDGTLQNPLEAYKRGATRIIKRPLRQSSLKAKIIMLVRRQRQRWALRNAMETTKQNETIDQTTHAYKADFFKAHLKQKIEHAQKWHKPLTVIFLSIPNIPGITQQFGERSSDHLLQQIFQWISSLSRVEDLVARYDEHEYCVVLPDTPLEEAEIVMHRIAGILSYTDFAIIDVFQAISIWVEVGISAIEADDDVEKMIMRARKNID
jgi:two-component system, cell cycle response regulator